MLAYTYVKQGKFELLEKAKPTLVDSRDAIVRVTLGSICTSDLHIKHGSVPRAVPGITVGHEMVGVVEQVGSDVVTVKPGDRVTVNVETFCGECFFCKHGFVNNCTDPDGGWALGCRIDGGQAEYVRVPHADQGLNRIPDTVSDEQALFVGINKNAAAGFLTLENHFNLFAVHVFKQLFETFHIRRPCTFGSAMKIPSAFLITRYLKVAVRKIIPQVCHFNYHVIVTAAYF